MTLSRRCVTFPVTSGDDFADIPKTPNATQYQPLDCDLAHAAQGDP
jgi:hypothetical protein